MGSNLFEWVVRTAMLVLAGLVTLSILGSIAAMSNDATFAPGDLREPPVLTPAPQPSAAEPAPGPAAPPAEPAQSASAAETTVPGDLVTVPAQPETPRPERWLEAIAYALLAIAGLLALLLILLWRGVRALARIADRAELGHHAAKRGGGS
ncbi:MAG TPA: hypothetical protein VGB70_04130 [Allosphingosinicella sp.]|jgi:hypothetical protein